MLDVVEFIGSGISSIDFFSNCDLLTTEDVLIQQGAMVTSTAKADAQFVDEIVVFKGAGVQGIGASGCYT